MSESGRVNEDLTREVLIHLQKQEEHLKTMRLGHKGQKRFSWRYMAKDFLQRFGMIISTQQLREKWSNIIEKCLKMPNPIHIQEVIELFRTHGSKYNLISLKMKPLGTPFEYPEYTKKFIAKFLCKMVRRLQLQVYKRLGIQIKKMPSQEIKKVVSLLVKNPVRHRGLRQPVILRNFLVKLHFLSKQNSEGTNCSEIQQAYDILKNMKKQMFSTKKYDQFNQWSYEWSAKQLRRIYQLYAIFGNNVRQICNTLNIQFNQKQTYIWLTIRCQIFKLFRSGLLRLIQVVKERNLEQFVDFKFQVHIDLAKKFLWSKNKQNFTKTVQLMGLGFGEDLPTSEIIQIIKFVMSFLGERKAYICENYYPLIGVTKLEAFYGTKIQRIQEKPNQTNQ